MGWNDNEIHGSIYFVLHWKKKKKCSQRIKTFFKKIICPQISPFTFFVLTAVIGNDLWSFKLCYKDRCLNDPLLLSISCLAELSSEIKYQLPANSGCIFRNNTGICLITVVSTPLPTLSLIFRISNPGDYRMSDFLHKSQCDWVSVWRGSKEISYRTPKTGGHIVSECHSAMSCDFL